MRFLLSANQKSYSFLLKQLRDGDNVSSYAYPITTTLALDTLICTEGGIQGNQKLSTYENSGGKGGRHNKEHMGHTFTQKKGGK